MDHIAKQTLKEKLQSHIKKASANVDTAFTAEKGDYKIVLTADNVKQFYKGHEVGSTRVADFDNDTIDYINSSSEEAALTMLEAHREEFNEAEFEGKQADSNQTEKTAAHATLDEETAQKVTQKQFDDQKAPLHPRKDDYYTNITQKQLPEHGQRPGTYDQITQGQFRDERTTFYGADRTAGDWKQEDRNTVTESQFEEGVSDYSDVGQSDRGQTSSKFDGDLAKQWQQIGEKQLEELIKHHEWTEPLTTTEGPDQLPKQDGELSRVTAEIAGKIVKESLTAIGNTVLAAGATPAEVKTIIKKLVSHSSKYPVLENVLRCYAGLDITAIQSKIAKAQYFEKAANASQNWSETLVADVLVRQLAKLSYSPKFIVQGLISLAETEDFENRIHTASEECLSGNCKAEKIAEDVDIFRKVIAGNEKIVDKIAGTDDDGLYSFTGKIAEVGSEPGTTEPERKKFAHAAAELAKQRILVAAEKEIELVPHSLDVNEEAGEFEIVFVDASKNENSLQVRAERRRTLVKESQMGGAGGMPPAAGPEMGNPMAPPGGAEMGAPPPGEALSQEPPMEGDLGAGTGEPKPPGSLCPICGSEDVDVDNGEMRCNTCGGEASVSVKLDVHKWPETIIESEEGTDEGFGLGAEEEAMGAEEGMGLGGEGDGTTLPNVPVGASVKVKDILTKLASSVVPPMAVTMKVTPRMLETLRDQKIHIGKVCPNCGGHDTDLVKSASHKGQDGICWSCWQEYNFQVKTAQNKRNKVYAQWVWAPRVGELPCEGCSRVKTAFNESLKNYGVTREQFDSMTSMKEQGDLILKMAAVGSLDLTAAMTEKLPITKIAASARWQGFKKFDKFPSASCRERISRKWGENATAMSGPCQGNNLADCVCGQLETLGIYADGLAAKVASATVSEDPMENSPLDTCIAMFIRDNYTTKEACVVCDGLRAAHADPEDLIIEAIAQINPMAPKPMRPMPAKPMPPKPMAAPGDMMNSKPMKPMVAPPKPMVGPGMEAPADQMLGAKPMMEPGMGAPDPMGAPANPMAKPMADPMASPEPGMPGAPGGEMPGMPGMPGSKPMMDPASGMSPMPGMDPMKPVPDNGMNPLDEPVTDATEIGGDIGMDGMGGLGDMGGDMDMELEMSGDFGGLGDEGLDMGIGGEEVTIQLPPEAVEALKVLFDALSGQLGDDMIDTTGDDFGLGGDDLGEGLGGDLGDDLDMGDVTEDVVDGDEGGESFGDESDGGSDSEGDDGGIPGLFGDDDEGGDDNGDDNGDDKDMLHKKTEDKDCSAPMCDKKHMDSKPMEAKPMEPNQKLVVVPVADSKGEVKEAQTEQMTKEASAMELENMLFNMKKGSLKNTQTALDSVFDGLLKQAEMAKEAKDANDIKTLEYKGADEGSKITITPAQDSTEVKFKDNGKIGHEEAFTTGVADGPDVPRAAATIGDEDSSNTINDKSDTPTIPSGSPAMAGEKDYRPEKQREFDPNQGSGQTTSAKSGKEVKTAGKCSCPSDCKCQPCKGDSCPCEKNAKTKEKNMKTANTWNVPKGHQHYEALKKKASAGQWVVELQDNNTYDMTLGKNGFTLIAQNNEKIKKESQTVTPNTVKDLQDDPDINPSSGPGAGKTHVDKAHSLGVTEPKPSEGMSEPSVPDGGDGQLAREHTYTNKLEGPTIPAGGGSHPEYDQNEKNDPEKLDQTLGKENDLAAMAKNNDDAVKIAGQMLKANLITIDELSDQVKKLSGATPEILRDYENMIRNAETRRGMQKEASADSVETVGIVQKTVNTNVRNFADDIQSLMTLNQRNEDHERYTQEKGNARLWH